ncbi:uncharacterized protein [Oncorhynchus clarkii lewisi]|uniref:uncharacterized protein n=1 Tax=Oncorhynchus clarkii lewisi TaxID=490388 RepID=UPI0039B898CE
MEAVFGLLGILVGVSHGMVTSCDARQNRSCYAALGGTVYLQLVTDARAYEITLKKDYSIRIFRMKDNEVIIHDSITARSHFFISNGTFMINNTERTDLAQYVIVTFDKNGTSLGTRGLQLLIEAPVSPAKLSSECLSNGEVRVSCSSEGDGPQYSWTLDGQPLRDTEASPGDKTDTITLKKGQSGDLTCTVKNNINSVTTSERISHCPALIYINCTKPNKTKTAEWVISAGNTLCAKPTPVATTTGTEASTSRTTTVIIWMVAGSLAAVVIVLVMVLAVYCVQKKNKHSKTPANDDSQVVEYADVRILKKQMRQEEREASIEVEYGQFKTLHGPRRKVDTPDTPEEEDCVYARVQKGQEARYCLDSI